MKTNLKRIVVLILLVLLSSLYSCGKEKNKQLAISNENSGIYILYNDNNCRTRLKYLTDDLEEISDRKVRGGWDLCAVGDSKVYVTIAGDADMLGDSVSVLKAGKVIKNIKLKYDMPLDIKLNPYDGKAYITHKYKITYYEENCISIIDTKTDKLVEPIMYNKHVRDITFTKDNQMIVSAMTMNDECVLDIINLSNGEIEQSIKLEKPLSSIYYCKGNHLVYGTSTYQRDNNIYVIDYKKGEVLEKIPLNHLDLTQIEADRKNNNLIYISNIYADKSFTGNTITIFDCESNAVVSEITCADGLSDYVVDDYIFAQAVYLDKVRIITQDNTMEKQIEIQFPTSIEKAY